MANFLSENTRVVMLRLVLLFLALTFTPLALAADQGEVKTTRLTVAVAECPPFVIFENGQYSGLAVYLWEQIGREMGLSWDYAEYSLGNLLETIESEHQSELPDVGISCTSVTAEREELIDFSHSFNETYTAIAVRQTTLWSAVTGFLTSPRVLHALFIVLGIAVLIGAVFYLLEHKINKKLFSSPTVLGRIIEPFIIGLMFISNGPIRFYRFKTLTARVLATVLTLSSTFVIAAITAVLASSFTLTAMQTEVRSLDDLRRAQVGALAASTSSAFLQANGIRHQTRLDLDTLVNDLDAGKLDAIVSDAAFLTYRINRGKQEGKFQSLTVLPNELEAQNYAFILSEDSPLREGINRALLTERVQNGWRDKIRAYFGE
ncbi:MAG: transporter substrate-binding domain-containing protein [Xanthomonadales bacterium]|jgi:polar amino acid transport system substrate-binding protein|nr:transporter substrate-binding domain-containing protein [Xanthomonadales bacterium]